jgi:capsular polysaccharide transport system permease protein
VVSRGFEDIPAGADRSFRTFWRKAQVQGRIIRALMLREVLTRFGRESLGVFWLMGEPLILTVGVILMWSVAGVHSEREYGPVPLALTGSTRSL